MRCRRWLPLSLFVFFVACSRHEESQPFLPDLTSGDVQGKSLYEARADLARAKLLCDESGCPSEVAMMISTFQVNESDPDARYFMGTPCTATLVHIETKTGREKYFLTAGHCVPRRFHQNFNCSRDIAFVFSDQQRYECDEVVKVFNPVATDQWQAEFDYALIRVKGVEERPSLELANATERLQSDSVRIVGIRLSPDFEQNFEGSLIITECEAVAQSFLLPEGSSAQSPNAVLRGCGIRNGYSGGPVVKDRHVLGVISLELPIDAPFDGGVGPGHIGLASQASCFDVVNKKFICDSELLSQKLLYLNSDDSLDHSAYLTALRSDRLKFPPNSEREDFLRSIKEFEQQIKSQRVFRGFKGPWVFRNERTEVGVDIRLAVPTCALKNTRLPRATYSLDIFYFHTKPLWDLSLRFMGRVRESGPGIEMEYSQGTLRIFAPSWSQSPLELPIPQCMP